MPASAHQSQPRLVADVVDAESVVVHDSLAAAEVDWRQLEAEGILTPYQRLDWVRAALDSGLESGGKLAIVVVRAESRPVALIPLVIERCAGFAVARLAGTEISNSDWLVFADGSEVTPEWLAWILDEVRERVGPLDLVCLLNQPAAWAGRANPVLALGADPAPSNLYTATIGSTPSPYIDHRLPKRRRDDIRRGARRLEEAYGALELRRVRTGPELERVHAAFLAQRAERFEEMGVDNLFARPDFVSFFDTLARDGFERSRPALCFHALYAGDEIVATACGTYAGNHYSQYINSTTSGPAAKYSLMSILIARLMDELTAEGIQTFDMGIGDFPYKEIWTAPEPLYDSLIPLTPAGHVAALGVRASRSAKRAIKQNPKLWGLAQALRKALHTIRRK